MRGRVQPRLPPEEGEETHGAVGGPVRLRLQVPEGTREEEARGEEEDDGAVKFEVLKLNKSKSGGRELVHDGRDKSKVSLCACGGSS